MNVFTTAGYLLTRIHANEGITHAALAAEMRVSVRWINKQINELLNEGALIAEGAGQRRRVYVNPHYRDDMGFAVQHLGRLSDVGWWTE